MNGMSVNQYRKTFRTQPAAFAGGTFFRAHKRLGPLANSVRCGVFVILFQTRQHTGNGMVVLRDPAVGMRVVNAIFLLAAAKQQGTHRFFADIAEGSVQIKTILLSDCIHLCPPPCTARFSQGYESLLVERFPNIRDDEVEIKFTLLPQSVAGTACAVGRIERKGIRCRFFVAASAQGT